MSDIYNEARKLAEKAIHKAVVSGEYPYLPVLDEILDTQKSYSTRQIGIMEIPLEMVVGTKTAGRSNTFACNFMPAASPESEFALKWTNFYRSQNEEGMRDPVIVFEYKHLFYVQEGNKRVSVMKYLDALTIAAEVTRIIPGEPDEIDTEFFQFFELTKLYDFYFQKPGQYKKLTRLLGQSSKEPWDSITVSRLKASFHTFQASYRKKYTGESYCSPSEAFLKYLEVYGRDILLPGASANLTNRLLKMRNTFMKEETLEILDHPETGKSAAMKLKSVLPILPEKPLSTAFIYESSPSFSASVYEHELGRLLLENRFKRKIRTVTYENCDTDEKTAEALKDASLHNDLVITTSPLQFTETYRQAVKNPLVKYLNHSLHLHDTALRTFDVKMYEAKFLLGALAAVFAENHRIAYIADYPVYGTIANINAFAIGAEMIDPKAEILLNWSSTLDQDWQDQMKHLDIQVFSGAELPDFQENNLAYGIYRLDEEGPVNLASPVVNWANFYEKIISGILAGTYGSSKGKAVNYWPGMESGVLDVNVSGSLPYTSRKMISLLRNALCVGRLNPFEGELRSTEGIIKGPYDPVLSSEQIMTMNWLNDNVIGIIPDYTQLNDTGKKLTEIIGIGK